MFLKLFFLSVIFLSGTITHSWAMRNIPILSAEEQDAIQGAVYYRIHTHNACWQYPNKNVEYKPGMCTAYDLLYHASNTVFITYHNAQRQILALVDVTNLDGNIRNKYAKSRLDPNAKPKAFKAIICYRAAWGREVDFFDQEEKHLFTFSYDGPANKDSLMRFNKFVDLSTLKIIENHDDEGGCILF